MGFNIKFWNGSLQLLLILTGTQVISFFAYLAWYGVLKYPNFHDKTYFWKVFASNASESAPFFMELSPIPVVAIAIVCYPLGYLASRRAVRH
jgi:hypothetical protein